MRPPHTQTRIDSFMEAVTNTAIGFFTAQLANLIVIPLVLGVSMTIAQNAALGACFTVVSILRQYALRRLFDGRSPWRALKERFSS